MKVYAFFNEKGGVGKTTSALAMLSYFYSTEFFKAGEGKKAVAIDMDPHRSLTLLSGAKPEPGKMILDVLTDEASIRDAVTVTEFGDIIATNRELKTIDSQMDVDAAETVSQKKEAEENLLTLRQKVRELEGLYDYVILDCPPGYANIAMACMVAADSLILPAKASKASLYALSSVSPMVARAKKYNPDLRIAGVLLTHHNDRTNAAKYGAEASAALAEANLKAKVFRSAIRYSTAIEDSFFDGVPLFKRATPVTSDYRNFIEELLKGE